MFILISLLAAACGSQEVLAPRDGTVPPGVDLSGEWRIRPPSTAEQRRLQEAIGITQVRGRQSRRASRSQRSRGGLVHVFLETGNSLKVTQTPYALFISFDRAVVEEFRFGENRTVNVGEIEAQRVTGWDGSQLVVETLDKKGMKLTEQFQLLGAGDVLERRITFRNKKLEEQTIVQEFDRDD